MRYDAFLSSLILACRVCDLLEQAKWGGDPLSDVMYKQVCKWKAMLVINLWAGNNIWKGANSLQIGHFFGLCEIIAGKYIEEEDKPPSSSNHHCLFSEMLLFTTVLGRNMFSHTVSGNYTSSGGCLEAGCVAVQARAKQLWGNSERQLLLPGELWGQSRKKVLGEFCTYEFE